MKDFTRRPTWVDIDLEALIHNLKQAQACRNQGQRLLAVVKADAYGHGAVPVSRVFEKNGIRDFAVATLEEAVELRQADIGGSILVLGGCFAGQEQAFHDYRLVPALLDIETARRLNDFSVRHGYHQRVHLKVDSGMGRVGFQADELADQAAKLKNMSGLQVEGLMTHFACADELDSQVTTDQQQAFLEMLGMLRKAGFELRDIHQSNSAGLSAWNCPECTLARPGIMLYGGLPGPGFDEKLDLQPVMNLRSCIAQLRVLPEGRGVSYGHSFVTRRRTRVAVLPIGYADGYNRLLSNRGQAILHGRKVAQIGRVCMDWIMFDVTDLPEVKVGDCLTLLGSSGGLTISGDDWADALGTISYEVFCRIGARVPRNYR